MKKPHLFVLAMLLLFAARSRAADRVEEASSGTVPDRGDLVLFPLDDVSLPWRENLKLTLVRPAKYPGNPVMRAGPEGGVDGYGTIAYGTLIKQAGKFRLWYVASPRVDSRIPGDDEVMEYYRPPAYAESADGIHWQRPDLGLVTFRGNKHNNLVLIEPADEPYARGNDFIAVLFDRSDPDPSRRYKMAYITHDPARAAATTATATSPDGLRWKLANTTMFTQGHFENTSLTRFDGLYYLAGQNIPWHDASLMDGSPAGRVMKVFFSPDFNHWSGGRALAFYRSDYDPKDFAVKPYNPGQENHMGAGLWNRGNVILGFYGRWHGNTIAGTEDVPLRGLKIDLGLVVSNDAIHYREPVRNFVEVPRGGPDDWDSEGVLQSNCFANTATETYIWYSHWYTSRQWPPAALPEKLSPVMVKKADSIGLLRLPRDRFGYFSPLQAGEASCLSRPLHPALAARLFFNAEAAGLPGAALRIALVDDAERAIPGYTGLIDSSSLKAPVSWSGGKETLPVHAPFRIKIEWPAGAGRSRLYALYIEHE